MIRYEIFDLMKNWEKNIDKIRRILKEEQSEGLVAFLIQKYGATVVLTIWPEAKERFPWLFALRRA